MLSGGYRWRRNRDYGRSDRFFGMRVQRAAVTLVGSAERAIKKRTSEDFGAQPRVQGASYSVSVISCFRSEVGPASLHNVRR